MTGLQKESKVLSEPQNYTVDVVVNASNVETLEKIFSALNATSSPVQLSNNTKIDRVDVTTVCISNETGFQCKCEEQFAWPYSVCVKYGACDHISNGVCKCISAVPADDLFCQPISQLLTQVEYDVVVEVNVTDINTVDHLRNLLSTGSYFPALGPTVNITDIKMTTVCSPDASGFQCRCENDHLWPCDKCATYGKCDSDANSTCGCIKSIPTDGRYCQQNVSSCPPTTTSPSTAPPAVVSEYLISVELNTTDVAAVNELRRILENSSYPLSISNNTQISDVNISTVCSPTSAGFQCRCEDQYRWSCDQCLQHGSCDSITEDTCGCINALPPDGQYCQSVHQMSKSSSPAVYEYLLSVELNTTDVSVVELLRNIRYPLSLNEITQISYIHVSTVCSPTSAGFQCRCEDQYRWSCDQCLQHGSCDSITEDTCGCINALPPDGQYCQSVHQMNLTSCPVTSPAPTTSPAVYEYLLSVELNTTDVSVVELLRNIRYPLRLNEITQISYIHVSTVCSPTSAGFQCRCEDQYRWSCDQCLQHGSCDSITEDTCGCINALPPDGQYCQSVHQMSKSSSPAVYEYLLSVELNTTDVSVVELLRNIRYPLRLNEITQISYIHVSTVCSPTSAGFQCRCEDQYRWSCDQCLQHGSCDSITEDTCGCINALPPDGQYCQSVHQMSKSFVEVEMVLTFDMHFIPDYNNKLSTAYKDLESRIVDMGIKEGRFRTSYSDTQSMLTVKNVILADAGLYECTLYGEDLFFYQKGHVLEANISPAPVVRVSNEINIKCEMKKIQLLECCVQATYKVKWFDGSTPLKTDPPDERNCIKYKYEIKSCNGPEEKTFTCKCEGKESFEATTKLVIFIEDLTCKDDVYGTGRLGDRSSIMCEKGQEGRKTAVCQESQKWELKEDTCIITKINELLIDSQDLVEEEVVEFVRNLSQSVKEEQSEISNSSATLVAIISMLNTIANVSTNINQDVMQDVLDTIDVIIGENTKQSWEFLNSNKSQNASSEFLGSLEMLSDELNGTFTIETQRIQLNRTIFSNSFNGELTSNASILIPTDNNLVKVFITTIVLSTLNNVMPARNSTFDPNRFNDNTNKTVNDNAINSAVVLVKVSKAVRNVTLSYNKLNGNLLFEPQCVFWNFTLLDNLGAWDKEGCMFVSDINNTVTCNCNHLTSFSILMSTNIPPAVRELLDIITYIGVGISLASLVICLIIEGYVWRAITKNSTAFMRHVSIVNTALSLLIADICFIIGASIAKNPLENPAEDHNVPVNPCSTATFFMHFFYLALFFWMLVSGLLLFYRTVMVFSHMSKSTMLAIGFSLGYGCPLIIAVITVASTAPGSGYIRKDYACWLNWVETKALLALVIPALTIVLINILIVIVVLFKMLRRGVGDSAQSDERHTLVVIIRCVAILTPLFGLTWSLGVGTMISSQDKGIHIAFAFFNSLQGFFILVFGTLFDSKIRSLLSERVPTLSTASYTRVSDSFSPCSQPLAGFHSNFTKRTNKKNSYL
ncbi:adhesion G protein-coupled receptor F5-like [Xenentodon cancila]